MAKSKQTLYQQLQEESAGTLVGSTNWRQSALLRAVLFVLCPLVCALFFPGVTRIIFHSQADLRTLKGQIWHSETLVAQSTFPLRKSESRYMFEVDSVRQASPLVFQRSATDKPSSLQLYDAVARHIQHAALAAPQVEGLRSLCATLVSRDLISIPTNRLNSERIVVMRTNVLSEVRPASQCIDSLGVQQLCAQALREVLADNQINLVVESVLRSYPPVLQYWPSKTEEFRTAAAENVRQNTGIVRRGDILVSQGEVIDDRVIERLINYGYILDESRTAVQGLSIVVGSLLHAALICALLAMFLYFLRVSIYFDNVKVAWLLTMVVFSAIMSWVSLSIGSGLPAEYAVLIPAFAMIVTIFFDSTTGFVFAVTVALMFAAVRSSDVGGAFAQLLAGTLGAYSVRDLRTRTQLFRSIAFILAGFLMVLCSDYLVRNHSLDALLQSALFSSTNAVLSPVITFAVIAVSERYFGLMTDLTLREYDNLNHPLLREMSEKAPGTYQHTLSIAHLVEAAAYEIDASPLLARVGAYFHDIGKIPKAEYFIENQIELENKHDLLSAKKSAAIIRNHIQDGIELAREYSLPEKIADFIPMHHGTALIKHFYAKAVDEGEPELSEEQFRYPGPKPNSKETALVMLADGVEAISRTVDDRQSLEERIDKIFKTTISDGQLDDCDLTMKDLSSIKEVFARNLVGAHHQRTAYKEIPGSEKGD